MAGIIPAEIHRACRRVYRKPLVELIFPHTGRVIIDAHGCAPACAAISRAGYEDICAVRRGFIHPRAVERSAVAPTAAVGITRRVEQGTSARHGRNAIGKGNGRGRDGLWLAEGGSPIE